MSEQMEYPDDLELDLARLFRAVAGKWLTVLTAAALCAAVVLGVMLFLRHPGMNPVLPFMCMIPRLTALSPAISARPGSRWTLIS